MNVREKLIELIQNAVGGCARHWAEVIADHLIAHDVTVQEEAKLYWKPCDDRTSILTCSACDTNLGCREDANFCPECGAKFVINEAEPPKGE